MFALFVNVALPILSIVTLAEGGTVCTTPVCMEMNEYLLKRVDLTKSPCGHFYNFACGLYKGDTHEVENIQSKINEQITDILKEPVHKNDHKALKMIKEMFQGCLKRGSKVEDLKKLIHDIGGWSLLDVNWKPEDFNLELFFSKSIVRGYYPKSFFAIEIARDPQNVTRKVIQIGQHGAKNFDDVFPPVTWLYNFNSTYIWKIVDKFRISRTAAQADYKEYRKFLNEMDTENEVQTTAPSLDSEFKSRMKQLGSATVAHFNLNLLRDFDKDIYDQPQVRARYTISDLEKTYVNIPWKQTLTQMFQPTVVPPDHNVIVVECKKCMASIDRLIGKTPTRDLVSYLMWSLVLRVINDVDDDIFETDNSYIASQKVDYCVGNTTSRFRRVLDYEYHRRHFNKEIKADITRYANRFTKSMKQKVDNSTWLDRPSKKQIVAKIYNNLRVKAVWDDEVDTEQQLEEYYAGLETDAGSYFSSLLSLSKLVYRKTTESFEKPLEPVYLESTTTPAAYELATNVVQLGASIVSGVFYPKCKPEYFIYSTIGVLFGHELHHALDDVGYEYDSNGFHNTTWLNPPTKKKFQDKFECVRKQYSRYQNVRTSNTIDGNKTLSENFCDVGGMAVTYHAYETAIANGLAKDQSLPNFQKYNARQMFWISFGALLCENPSKELVLQNEQTATHPQSRIRVNGVAKNSEEFSKDFNCKPSSHMNPTNKCVVWD